MKGEYLLFILPFLLILSGCPFGNRNAPAIQGTVEKGAADFGAGDISDSFKVYVGSYAIVISGDVKKELVKVNVDKRKILPPKADKYKETIYKDGKRIIEWSTRKPDKNDAWFNRWLGIAIGSGGIGFFTIATFMIGIVIKFFKKKKGGVV